jgi:16S rRNA (adenine1518-N6/adenine1519-N6)-dimethyltransferase
MPRRSPPKLGQHFLADTRYRRRILEALHLRPNDLVIEIGAGRGAMTSLLAERARRVVAIEVDPELVNHLQRKFEGDERIEILAADILATDIGAICRRHAAEECVVFGNLPYYITSPIIHHLLAAPGRLRGLTLLVQQEVAERLTAGPGTRAYGYLSVLAQIYSQPRLLFSVPAGAFSPAPKVRSALVDFQMRDRLPALGLEDGAKFLEFVKRCFAQKRKNLLNNLAGNWTRPRVERELASLGLSPRLRAEQLSLQQFAALFERLG